MQVQKDTIMRSLTCGDAGSSLEFKLISVLANLFYKEVCYLFMLRHRRWLVHVLLNDCLFVIIITINELYEIIVTIPIPSYLYDEDTIWQ